MDGEVNSHNSHQYAPARQPLAFNFQQNISREKVTVWSGLCGNSVIIGPIFFEGNVNGVAYLQMINEEVVPRMQNFFQQHRDGHFRYLLWTQDGEPAHRLITVQARLQELFHDHVIAVNHPIERPRGHPTLPLVTSFFRAI